MNNLAQIIPTNVVFPSKMSVDESREAIFRFEEALKGLGDTVTEAPVVDHFAPGVYAREMHIPAGAALTGKIHKTEHLNIISKGIIDVYSEDGRARYEAPYTFTSKAGTKRAGYALTDTVWTTIHVTDETDLDKIEKEVIAESYDEIILIEEGEE